MYIQYGGNSLKIRSKRSGPETRIQTHGRTDGRVFKIILTICLNVLVVSTVTNHATGLQFSKPPRLYRERGVQHAQSVRSDHIPCDYQMSLLFSELGIVYLQWSPSYVITPSARENWSHKRDGL